MGLTLYYAWLLTHCVPDILHTSMFGLKWSALWLFPIWLPLVGILRTYAVSNAILRAAAYIRMIEDQFDRDGLPIGPNKGWESFVQKARNESILLRMVSRSADIWVILSVLTVIVGLFVGPKLSSEVCVPSAL